MDEVLDPPDKPVAAVKSTTNNDIMLFRSGKIYFPLTERLGKVSGAMGASNCLNEQGVNY